MSDTPSVFERELPLVSPVAVESVRAIDASGASVRVVLADLPFASADQGAKAETALQDSPQDGKPYARKDGEWFEVEAIVGPAGKSAYELAVQQGYIGTLEQWLDSLQGEDGLSAFEVAQQAGFVGTRAEWLESLKGEDGEPGLPGLPGEDGDKGDKGDKGDDGAPGSVIHPVSAAPAASLGVNGDYAIWQTASATTLYGPKAAGAWPAGTALSGTAGAAGSVIHKVTAAPAAALGVNGDYAIWASTTDTLLYGPKASGAWPAGTSIKGSAGSQGLKGDKGDQGIPGPSSACFPTASFSGGAGPVEVGASQSLYVPFGFTVTGCTLIADQVGTLQVDVRLSSFSNYPPSSLDSICGGAPPTLSNSDRTQVADLSLWTTAVPSGSVLQFICTACVGIRHATLVLTGYRS